MNTESLLPILLELLAKSALIALAAALLLRAWRGVSAAQRHFVWFVALATVMLLPLTRLVAPFWKIPLASATKPAAVTTVRLPMYAAPVETDLPATVPVVMTPVQRPFDWRLALLGVWGGGAALPLGYRLFGSWRLHRLLRRSVAVDELRIRLLFSRTLNELGLHRQPEIRFSDECRVPITWGSFRPVMLLPKAALEWSDNWVLAALRHECAHICRYDYLTRWFAHVACALYWPNPLVWLLARSLRVAQELAADDLVLRAGTPPEEYASQLVDAARTVTTHGFFVHQAVAMACPSTLEDRVRAIVDGRRDRRPLSRLAVACGSLTIALALGLSTGAQLRSDEEKPAAPKPANEPKAEPKTEARGPQIEITARFIEFARSPEDNTGLTAKLVTEKSAVYSDPQFQVIIRTLNQEKGADLMLAPRITTRPGQPGKVEVIREFRYPSDWEKDGTKWKPVKYDVKNAGITMEVEPRIADDGSIELHETATFVDFMGFTDLDGNAATAPKKKGNEFWRFGLPPVPEGHRSKPLFLERKSDQRVKLTSGDTVAISDLRMLPDPWPDMPESKDSGPRKVLIFITARIIAPAPETRATKDGAVATPAVTDLVVTVSKSGDIKLNGESISRVDLKTKLDALRAGNPDASVIIRGDADTPYKAIMDFLDLLKEEKIWNVSFANVGLVSSKEKESTTDGLTLTNGTALTLTAHSTGTAKDAGASGEAIHDGPITKEWKLPFDLVPAKADDSGPTSAKDWLTSKGVKFEGEASAIYNPANSRLIARNTQEQIDLIDQIVQAAVEEQGKAEKASGNLDGVTDEVFVRRRYLDFLGRVPTPDEVRAFLADPKPSEEKRQALVERLTEELKTGAPTPAAQESAARKKAEKIIIPKLEFKEATLNEAFDFLRKQAVESDPEKVGVKITVKPGTITGMAADARITMSLRDVPVIEGLRYVTGLANVEFVVTPDALVVQPVGAGGGAVVAPIPLPRPESGASGAPGGAGTEKAGGDAGAAAAGASAARQKAETIVIPVLEFKEATVNEALDLLRKKAVESDPEKTGVKIIVKPGTIAGTVADVRLTVSLKAIPVIEALRYVTGLANLEFAVTPDALVVQPIAAGGGGAGAGPEKNTDGLKAEIERLKWDLAISQKQLEKLKEASGEAHSGKAAEPRGDPANRDPGDLFVNAYQTMQKAEQLEVAGDFRSALETMQKAGQGFEKISAAYPNWQPEILAFRKARVAAAVERLKLRVSH